MNIRIIQVLYDSGRRGERMGRGPLHFLENKADDALRANGWQVEVEAVESQQSFTTENTTAYDPSYDGEGRVLRAGIRLMQHVCRLVEGAAAKNV